MKKWDEVLKAIESMVVDRAVETIWIKYNETAQGLIIQVRHKDVYGQDIPALDLIMSQDYVNNEWTKPITVDNVYGYTDCHETMVDLAKGVGVMFYIGETIRALDSGE